MSEPKPDVALSVDTDTGVVYATGPSSPEPIAVDYIDLETWEGLRD